MAFAHTFRKVSITILTKSAGLSRSAPYLTPMICAQRNFSSKLVRTITVSPPPTVHSEDLQKVSPGVFKTPRKPLSLKVEYADTAIGRENVKFEKTIVAIHGCPGYHTHFDTLIDHFKDSNVRVVAPNLPDFAHTRQNGFWNTTPERASFVKQFLRDLGISEIDVLISHSFGIQCASFLLTNPDELKFASAAFFAPQTMQDPIKKRAIENAGRLFMFKQAWWYWFLEKAGVHNNKFKDVPMKMESFNEFMLLCSALFHDRPYYTLIGDRLEKLTKTTNIPITLMYGGKERMISKNVQRQFNDHMGIQLENVPTLDPEVNDDQVPYTGNRFNSYIIKDAGHFAHMNHARFSNKMVDNILLHLSKDTPNSI